MNSEQSKDDWERGITLEFCLCEYIATSFPVLGICDELGVEFLFQSDKFLLLSCA